MNCKHFRMIGIFVLISVISVIILFIFSYPKLTSSSDIQQYNSLISNKKNPQRAKQIAQSLLESEIVLELSAKDIDIFGGNTRGWSGWILLNTKKKEKAIDELNKVAFDDKFELSNRIEALFLLWELTSDKIYITHIYDLINEPGNLNVMFARQRLCKVLNPEKIKRINTDNTKTIGITKEELKLILLTNPGLGE